MHLPELLLRRRRLRHLGRGLGVGVLLADGKVPKYKANARPQVLQHTLQLGEPASAERTLEVRVLDQGNRRIDRSPNVVARAHSVGEQGRALCRHAGRPYRCLMKVPSCSSSYARRSSSGVFITMGPYHATGSSIGFPDTSRNLIPASPAWTVTASPLANNNSDRFCTSPGPGFPPVTTGPTCSVRTAPGSDASRNVPPPSNT